MSVLGTGGRDRAAVFYQTMFGWPLEPFQLGETPGALFCLPGYTGGEPLQPGPRDVVAVMLGAPPEGERARWNVGFRVGDAEAVSARAAQLGGRVLSPPHDVSGMRNAVLTDPQGASFSVSQLIPARRRGATVMTLLDTTFAATQRKSPERGG